MGNAGIHSHADGLIHTHPYVVAEEGNNATIGKFFELRRVGAVVGFHRPRRQDRDQHATTVAGSQVRAQKTSWSNGDTCPFGQYKGEKVQLTWAVDGKTKTGNPADYHMQDGETVAIDMLPKGADMPFPPAACTSFAEISDQNSAVLSKNSPCRTRDHDHDARRPRRRHRPCHIDAVKAVVLVGGEGTRLRPLTYATPKPLLPVVNQPFLERQLTWLAHHGVDEVVLSLGYLPDAFEAHFPEGRFGDLKLRYAVEDHPLGTAGAIRFASRGIEERIVVCNGDVLTTLDLDALVAFHDARGAEATIYLTQVDDPSAFGVVPTRCRRRSRRVRREAAEGRRAHQLDQRGHLRARAVGARAHPRPVDGLDRTRDLPAYAGRAEAPLRDGERCVLDRHRDTREVPAGEHRRPPRRARWRTRARRA